MDPLDTPGGDAPRSLWVLRRRQGFGIFCPFCTKKIWVKFDPKLTPEKVGPSLGGSPGWVGEPPPPSPGLNNVPDWSQHGLRGCPPTCQGQYALTFTSDPEGMRFPKTLKFFLWGFGTCVNWYKFILSMFFLHLNSRKPLKHQSFLCLELAFSVILREKFSRSSALCTVWGVLFWGVLFAGGLMITKCF